MLLYIYNWINFLNFMCLSFELVYSERLSLFLKNILKWIKQIEFFKKLVYYDI